MDSPSLGVAALVVILMTSSLLQSCVSSGQAIKLENCDEDPRLLGSWRSYRTSQLGPGRMNIAFECGCTYQTAAQLPWMRIKEKGNYRVEPGTIVLTRASGAETRWPYQFDGDKLIVEEHANERHEYEKTRERQCE